MERFDLVVIGSGPAGTSAASAYQQAGGGRAVVLSADVTAPYERPPLTKDALRSPNAPEPTALAGPDLDHIEVRLGQAVTGLDPDSRTLRVGADTLGYDRLVVASGASPTPLPGADEDAEIFYVRSFEQGSRLHEAAAHARSAVVVGSGFIGCEAAVSLAIRGIDVTLVTPEAAPQQARLGERVGSLITDLLTGYGVHLRTGVSVTSIEAPRTVHLDNGETLAPDLILAAVGITPNTDWLDGTGVQLHDGRIVVDEALRSSVEGTFAAGDVARAQNAVAGRPLDVEHWGDALTMGEVAGRSAADVATQWDSVPGFWTQLGEHKLKYSAWGDGYDAVDVVESPGSLTVWYAADSAIVGVLTYNADGDYDRGQGLIAAGAPLAAGRGGQAINPDSSAGEPADRTDPSEDR